MPDPRIDDEGFLLNADGTRRVPRDPETAVNWMSQQIDAATGVDRDSDEYRRLSDTARRVSQMSTDAGHAQFTTTEQRNILRMKNRAAFSNAMATKARDVEERLYRSRGWTRGYSDPDDLVFYMQGHINAAGNASSSSTAVSRDRDIECLLDSMSGHPGIGPESLRLFSEAGDLAQQGNNADAGGKDDRAWHATAALRQGSVSMPSRLLEQDPVDRALTDFEYRLSKLARDDRSDPEHTQELREQARRAQGYAANFVDPSAGAALSGMLDTANQGNTASLSGGAEQVRAAAVDSERAEQVSDEITRRITDRLAEKAEATGERSVKEVAGQVDLLQLGSSQRDLVDDALEQAVSEPYTAKEMLDTADLGSFERTSVERLIDRVAGDTGAAMRDSLVEAREEARAHPNWSSADGRFLDSEDALDILPDHAEPDHAEYDPLTGEVIAFDGNDDQIGDAIKVSGPDGARRALEDAGFEVDGDLAPGRSVVYPDRVFTTGLDYNPEADYPGWGSVKMNKSHVFRDNGDAWQRRPKGDLVGEWSPVDSLPPSARNVAPGEAAAALGGRCILCGTQLKDTGKHGGYGSSCIRKVR